MTPIIQPASCKSNHSAGWVRAMTALSSIAARISSLVCNKDSFLGRVWEVLPGPFVFFFGSNMSKENQVMDLLIPLIEEGEKTEWNKKELQSVQDFIQKLEETPHILRKLEHREDRHFFFLKGAFQAVDCLGLNQKISTIEQGNMLTPWDCGTLEAAPKWATFLQKLQAKGIVGLDRLIQQWLEVSRLSNSQTIQKLGKQSRAALATNTVAFFLVGKEEWTAYKLRSDLGGMSISDSLKHIFIGNGTHTGFIVHQGEELLLSHQIHKHLIHPSSGIFGGGECCLLFRVTVKPLLDPRIDEVGQRKIQEYFTEQLKERALIQRTFTQKSILWVVFSYVFGSKTLLPKNEVPSRGERCTGFVATVLHEALAESNKQAIKMTGLPLRPLFSSFDAIDRMTIPQLMKRLKNAGLLSEIEMPWIDQTRLSHDWKSL